MKIYYVNREDREDRNYLFRGAMAAMGFRPEDLVRVIAKNREDYPSRTDVCEAGEADGFGGYFSYQKDAKYPGYGSLVSGWSMMRAWRMIAEQDEICLFFLDDYYLKQPIGAFLQLIEPLDDLNIVQLAWHVQPDIFRFNVFDLPIQYEDKEDKVSEKSQYFLEGAWQGSSDWALVFSPHGAAKLLEYTSEYPYTGGETHITGMQHTYKNMLGIYSLKNQPRDVNGHKILCSNPWVGHLIEYTNHAASNLIGTQDIVDIATNEKLWES